jgi:hypothetical protein
MKRLAYIFIIVCLGSKAAFSAFDYPAYSARSAALSGSYIASTLSPDGFVLNPALLGNTSGFFAALNYSQLFNLKELRYTNGIIAYPFKSFGFGGAIEDFGNSMYRETRVSFSVSKRFHNNTLSLGLSLHYYQISVENYGNSATFGLNLGIRYQLLHNLHLAGTIENFNQPKLNGFGEQIPQRIQLGFQYQPVEQIAGHVKIQKDSWFSPEVFLGIEYKMFRGLELYTGFSTMATIPSFGVQFDILKVEINYAMQYHFDLGSTHFVGIAFNPKP